MLPFGYEPQVGVNAIDNPTLQRPNVTMVTPWQGAYDAYHKSAELQPKLTTTPGVGVFAVGLALAAAFLLFRRR